MAGTLGDQREHDQAQFAMIEHTAGAPTTVAAAAVFMGVSIAAVAMGAVAEKPSAAMAAMAVVSVFVVLM
jgi:hypothetical protein